MRPSVFIKAAKRIAEGKSKYQMPRWVLQLDIGATGEEMDFFGSQFDFYSVDALENSLALLLCAEMVRRK